MATTVIGLFETPADANNAVDDMISHSFTREHIRVMASDKPLPGNSATSTEPVAQEQEHGFMAHLRHFFSEIGLRNPDASDATQEDTHYSAQREQLGGTLVAVTVNDDAQANQAADIMNDHGAINIDERAAEIRTTTITNAANSALDTGGTAAMREPVGTQPTRPDMTLPVIEEELQVGRRKVLRGGVHIYSQVVEKPVETQVNLHEEHVHVERHPVDRPAGQADFNAFKEGSVDIEESAEEAVVAKRAHVVEEVLVSKEAQDRTQSIHDTVRSTKVDITPLSPDQEQAFAAQDSAFRTYHQSAYSNKGIGYEELMPAYRYGYHLGLNPRYRNQDWSQVEPQLRRDWEEQNTGSWDQYKDAVHYSWDRARQH